MLPANSPIVEEWNCRDALARRRGDALSVCFTRSPHLAFGSPTLGLAVAVVATQGGEALVASHFSRRSAVAAGGSR